MSLQEAIRLALAKNKSFQASIQLLFLEQGFELTSPSRLNWLLSLLGLSCGLCAIEFRRR